MTKSIAKNGRTTPTSKQAMIQEKPKIDFFVLQKKTRSISIKENSKTGR